MNCTNYLIGPVRQSLRHKAKKPWGMWSIDACQHRVEDALRSYRVMKVDSLPLWAHTTGVWS